MGGLLAKEGGITVTDPREIRLRLGLSGLVLLPRWAKLSVSISFLHLFCEP